MNRKPAIKRWVLSDHAALRAEERKITASEIELLLKSPDEVVKQGNKFIFAKRFQTRKDNMMAAVVIEKQENETWLVITLMINFEVKKLKK
jgi:hypothetical protein